jgi:hypothetical protein
LNTPLGGALTGRVIKRLFLTLAVVSLVFLPVNCLAVFGLHGISNILVLVAMFPIALSRFLFGAYGVCLPMFFIQVWIFKKRLGTPFDLTLVAVFLSNLISIALALSLAMGFNQVLDLWDTRRLSDILRYSARFGLFIVPAFFLSVYSQYIAFRRSFQQERKVILRSSWIANALSYGLMLLIVEVLLLYVRK